MFNKHIFTDNREVGKLELRMDSNILKERIELVSSRRGTNTNVRWNVSHNLRGEAGSGSELSSMSTTSSNLGFVSKMQHEENNQVYIWKCIWREPKQIPKTTALAWVPSSAHCALLED